MRMAVAVVGREVERSPRFCGRVCVLAELFAYLPRPSNRGGVNAPLRNRARSQRMCRGLTGSPRPCDAMPAADDVSLSQPNYPASCCCLFVDSQRRMRSERVVDEAAGAAQGPCRAARGLLRGRRSYGTRRAASGRVGGWGGCYPVTRDGHVGTRADLAYGVLYVRVCACKRVCLLSLCHKAARPSVTRQQPKRRFTDFAHTYTHTDRHMSAAADDSFTAAFCA